MIKRNEHWPQLSLEQWQDTCETPHLWSQVVGKTRLSQMPWVNHSWAIDQSESFVQATQKRLGGRARCRVGDALALPLESAAVDVTVSGLVLNFIPEPGEALTEMGRVTTSGGTIAVYIWDYAGTMDFLTHFWGAAVELDPRAAHLHEGKRFPDSHADALAGLFERAGLPNATVAPIDINTHFRDFADYWQPFLGGQGPAPTFALSLGEPERDYLRDALRERLPIEADGSIPMIARAWAAKSQV